MGEWSVDLATLQSICGTRFRDPNNNIVSASNWTMYLNSAIRLVSAASPIWPWLEQRSVTVSVTAGSRTGPLPTDIYAFTAVYNSTNRLLMTPIAGRSQYRDYYPGDDETGVPIHYHLSGDTIEVYPLPEAATTLKVDYIKNPTDLSSSSDEPAIPPQFQEALIDGALMLAYQDDANPTQAQVYEARYERILADMKAAYLGPRADRFHGVDDRWF